MVLAAEHNAALKSILHTEEIIPPTSSRFRAEVLPWAAQKYLQPSVVIRPTSVTSLGKCLQYLSRTKLSFGVRSQGVGSASAKDVLISLSAFDGVEFDKQNETVTVGAGQSWGSYYAKMEKVAPGYASEMLVFDNHESI
jgi:FAD/FMN-containing dehydrogenase